MEVSQLSIPALTVATLCFMKHSTDGFRAFESLLSSKSISKEVFQYGKSFTHDHLP